MGGDLRRDGSVGSRIPCYSSSSCCCRRREGDRVVVGDAPLCESAGGLGIEEDVVEVEVEKWTVVEDNGSEDGWCGSYATVFAKFSGGGGEDHLSFSLDLVLLYSTCHVYITCYLFYMSRLRHVSCLST